MKLSMPKFHSNLKIGGGRGSMGAIGAGGSSSHSRRPGSLDKLYKAAYCFYVYPDGEVEIAKNRYDDVTGKIDADQLIPIFTRVIADLKLKDTNLDIFKEGLSELLQETIKTTLEGDYYERAIRAKSARHGS